VTPSDLQRAFRHVPGQFLLLAPDASYTIVGASDAYLGMTATDASMFGRPLFEVFPPNPQAPRPSGVDTLLASLQRVIASGEPDTMATVRYDVRRPAGEGDGFEERYWHATNVPVLDDHGAVEYIVHHVEDARAKSKRDAIEILDSITEGFFTLDRQWRFDYVNREAHRILEREPGTLTGQVLWEVYPGLEGTEFETCYRRTMIERRKSSFTAFYPGHQRWYEVTCFPAVEGVSVYFRNVTEERQVQAERERLALDSARQRRMYETALNSTPELIYVFDLEHRIIYANEALLRMWGVTEAYAYGRKLPELGYEPWHVAMHDREIEQVVATRAPIRGEVPFSGTNGRRVYDYIFAPVLGPDGAVVAVAGTTRDVTERQAAEQAMREQAQRLTESDRAKDEFLATLSHELRNPLAPLRNSFELLRRLPGVDAKVAGVHAMMERQVNHLVRLVDDLLEMSRISRGTLSLRDERVPLETVVRNAVETSEPLVQAARHTLTVDLPDEPLWLQGDPVRLAQILANLLNNAARYTDDGGTIVVRARREGEQAVIAVRDNGIGIAPDVMPRMFEMFSRGHRETGRHQGGLGIGLALSRRLAQMHNGSLDASSDGPGRGSEFTVRLPLAAPAPVGEAVPDTTASRLAKTRVLVVDDNHDAGDSLGQVLDMLGAEVRVARDGAEGIEAFAAHRPSVVLLDIGMPGLNGYDVAREIRTRFPEHPATLVALTGWGQEDDRRRAREAGFDHHLVKPAEIDALQKLLSSIERGGASSPA
jgi:PAS domain S-box-containing protein